jgi:hypothetical protein
MKKLKIMLRYLIFLFLGVLNLAVLQAETIGVFYDHSVPQFEFAASDIKTALEKQGTEVELLPIAKLSGKYKNQKIVIALKSNNTATRLLKKEGGNSDKIDVLGEQAYALRISKGKQAGYWAFGGDIAGGMYGGLQIAEYIAFNQLKAIKDEEQKPYIKKRGIKFNIPLDKRVPSFDSDGDQDKSNIKDMWDMDFWIEYLDDLARDRYNILSYWTKHPFTAMIKLEGYPDVEVNDVIDGYGNFVKKMSIDEKIAFWQKVMQHAHDRSIDIFYITWNIYLNNAEGKYGITNEPTNEITKTYVRKCVIQFLKTYPYVSGIGVTAGEHMPGMTFSEREKWLWETYGLGIMDLKKEQPDRQIRFIHRHWYSSVSDIMKHFKDFDGTFDFCFKYAKAHLYSSPNIVFEDFLLDEMPEGIQSWWNLRNDDIFYTRWGDPEYTREFILNFDKEKTAGYLMGSDGYTWGRVYADKNPEFLGKPEIKKHWYNFMLWGRLGYNPDLSADIFKNYIKLHFPETSADKLYEAWKTASKIIPQTTRFFWRDWDFQWYPEACKDRNLVTVKHFMAGGTMEGSGILNIADYCNKRVKNEEIKSVTPLDVANNLENYATHTLQLINEIDPGNNTELLLTKNDIMAMSHLGNYYSEKIRGATNLYLFISTNDSAYQKKSIQNLEKALMYWKQYVAIMDAQYHERTYARSGKLDWNELTKQVEEDIEIAKTIEKFKIEINLENIKDGDEFPKGTDLTIKAEINSTNEINRVGLLVNGESIGSVRNEPFIWSADKHSVFKNMNSGTYVLQFSAIDKEGNKVEKIIKISVK